VGGGGGYQNECGGVKRKNPDCHQHDYTGGRKISNLWNIMGRRRTRGGIPLIATTPTSSTLQSSFVISTNTD